MKILIIGAGAVGQVYGWHLRQAGHTVSFFVKEQYRTEVSQGLTLYRLGHTQTQRQDWSNVQTLSDPLEVANKEWDQIWITLTSNALRGELASLVLAAVGNATVVCLQPDVEDCAYVRTRVPSPAQVVQGLITFISYQSPLPNQEGPKGIAYFLPPMAPGLFAGERPRVESIIHGLKAGGMSARIVKDFPKAAAGAPALLQPLMCALETNHWQLSTLLNSRQFVLGLEASGEALNIVHAEAGANVSLLKSVLHPWVWRLVLPLSRRLLPLDLEPYLHYHYGKVGIQSRLMLDTYIRLGQQHHLKTNALQQLRAAM